MLLPFGMFALLVLGIHAIADSFADWAFAFIDWFADLIEAAFARFADAALSEPDARKRVLAEALDVERRRDLARWAALGVEIVLVVRLGAACLGAWPGSGPDLSKQQRDPAHRRLLSFLAGPLNRLKALLERTGGYLAHLSIEKIYLPLAVALAALAGVLALFVALDNAFFALGRRAPAGLGAGRWLSPWPAALSSLLVLWRLGLPAVTKSLAHCQLGSERDRAAGEPASKRMLRGIWGAVLILPILIGGLWTGTPLGAWVERLLGAGS